METLGLVDKESGQNTLRENHSGMETMKIHKYSHLHLLVA